MKIIREWQASKNKGEGFIEWMLIRKLNFTGKLLVIIVLLLLWLKYAFNLIFMLNFFKILLVFTIPVSLYELICMRKK